MTHRLQDWPLRMDQFLKDAADRAFAWGTWDCALFTLAHADAITGSEMYDAFAGQCHDRESAEGILESMGGMEAALTGLFGNPLVTWRKAQRGDAVLFDSGDGPAIGFVGLSGDRIMALADESIGPVEVKIERALKAWRI